MEVWQANFCQSTRGGVAWHILPREHPAPAAPPVVRDVTQEVHPAAQRWGLCTRTAARRRTRLRARAPARASPQRPFSGGWGLWAVRGNNITREGGGGGGGGAAARRGGARARAGAGVRAARRPRSRARACTRASPPRRCWGGAGGSGVTQVQEGAQVDTLGQQRDRLALALAHGPVRLDAHNTAERTFGEDTDGNNEREEEVRQAEGGGNGRGGGAGAAGMGGDDGGTRESTSPEHPCGHGCSGEAGARRCRSRRRRHGCVCTEVGKCHRRRPGWKVRAPRRVGAQGKQYK